MLLFCYINLGGVYSENFFTKVEFASLENQSGEGGDNQNQMLGTWIQGIDLSWLASLKNPAPFFFETSGYQTS